MKYHAINGTLTYKGRMDLSRDISAAVEGVIAEWGFSSKQMSELTGVPQKFISKIRRGHFLVPRYEDRGILAITRLYVLLDDLKLGDAPFMGDIRENYPSLFQPYQKIRPAEENLQLLKPDDKKKIDTLVQKIVDSYQRKPSQ